MSTCRYCMNEGRHYLGGDQWLCFAHFLRLFAVVAPPAAPPEEKP